MQASLYAMQTALRVLAALTEKRHPDPADVAELRRLDPGQIHLPLDELACDVIQRAIRSREMARAEMRLSSRGGGLRGQQGQ
jgi:hypothetical protein